MIAVLSRDEDAVVDRDAPHSMQAMLDASANSPLSCSLSLSLSFARVCCLLMWSREESVYKYARRKRAGRGNRDANITQVEWQTTTTLAA